MGGKYRTSLFVASLFLVTAAIANLALAEQGRGGRDDDRCAGSRDVRLVNGRIHTLDSRNSIVSSVTIKNGKFTAVGSGGGEGSDGGPCMRVINLDGRTAVPGL